VYVENRDGNANVKFEQASTLKRMYNVLGENNISINRSRMDAGSYSKEIIDVVAANSKYFYIRSNKSAEMYEQICQVTEWKTVEINPDKYRDKIRSSIHTIYPILQRPELPTGNNARKKQHTAGRFVHGR